MAMNMDAILNLRANVQGTNNIVELNRGLMAVEGTAKGVSGAMRGLTGAAAGLSGALGALTPLVSAAGLVGLAKGALDAGDKMHDLAQSTGVSVEALGRFKKAAAVSGTDIDGVAKALVKLSKSMLEASVGGKQQAAAFKALGISVTDSRGQLKSADGVMLEIADRFKQMPDGVAKTALALKFFGRAGAEMIPMLDMGGAAIDKLSTKMTTAFAEKADAYKDKLAILGGKVGALGADLLVTLLPALDKITDAVTGAIDAFNKLPDPVKNFAVAGAAVAIAWGPTTSLIRGAIGLFAALTTAETAAGVAAAGAAPRIALLAGALQKLAAIGIVTAGINYVVGGISTTMSNIDELKRLKARRDAGGASGQFKGADQATVAAAKKQAQATLNAIAAERAKENKLLDAINWIGAQDRRERKLVLDRREQAARAVAGLDLSKFRASQSLNNGAGFSPDLDALKAGSGGGGGAASGKAASDAKRISEERAKQLLTSQKELEISQAELRIAQAINPMDKAAAEYALQKLRINQDFAGKFAEVKSLEERSNLDAAKRNQLERIRLDYLKQQTAELLRQAGIDNPDFGKKDTGIKWEDAFKFKQGGDGQGRLDDAYNKIKDHLKELADPVNQIIGAANALGDAFSNSFEGMITGAMTAKQALAGFFRDIASYFAKMATQMIADALRMAAIKFLSNLFSSVIGGFTGGGLNLGKNFASAGAGSTGISWASAVQFNRSANGNVFAANGIVPYAMGGIVDRSTLFPFAKGIGLMGEAGPEAIIPLKRGPDGRLGVAGGGGGTTNVTVNVDAKGSSVQGDSGKGNQLARVVAAAVQQEMIKQKRPGGLMAA